MNLGRVKRKVVIPVTYSDNLPVLRNIDETSIMRLLLQLLRTKCTDWKYEREWRCIQSKGACGDSWSPEGALLDSSPPTAVYVGCKADTVLIETLIDTCTNTLKVPLFKMVQSKKEYKLIPERIG